MKKLSFLIIMALLPVVASAYDILRYEEIPGYDAIIDGIYYKFSSQTEAKVSYIKYVIQIGIRNDGEITEGRYHFSEYSGDVVIPDSFTYNDMTYRVTGINDYAFESCTGLTSVTIPSSVTSIGENAFYGCKGLTDVYCLSEQVPEATNAFDNALLTDITLHVPDGAEDLYKTTFPWSLCFDDVPTGCIKIDGSNFPDYYFRNYLFHLSIGADGLLTEEERASFKELELYYTEEYSYECGPIQSLKGIEYFTELTKLGSKYLSVAELDLSNNAKLKELSCNGFRNFKKLNVSGCTELETLDCSFNYSLEEINLSGCSALQSINCNNNKLTEIDVSELSKLTSLYCNNNQLVELNASGLASLTTLECEANILTMLDVSGCTALTHLKYWKNKIKGAGMDALIESLPVTSEGRLYVYWNSGSIRCQNEMTTRHVAAAKAKGWAVRSYENKMMQDYVGIEPTDVVTFTQDRMATIILPTAPDASKGKYYKLDRCEDGMIVFAQELQPQARTPYIIVPNQDFSVEVKESELEGLDGDTVSIKDISFIGSYVRVELPALTGGDGGGSSFYIDIIDTTPDCLIAQISTEMSVVGALRAYLMVRWDDPINHGGSKGPSMEKMGIYLLDEGTGISDAERLNDKGQMINDNSVYDLSGRKISSAGNSSSSILNSSFKKGIYIVNGKKFMK